MDTVKMNPPMPEESKCPQCGTPLPSGALAGLCPACLLKMGAAKDTVTDAKRPPFNPPSVAELAPLFPQLEILELIGKGGMGAVYKARQKQLDRIVALKILPPGIGDDPAFAERFAREAKALAKLNHPNIVTLYEFGEASGQFYFLMEFVDGVNLRQLLHAGRISARGALAIVPQICDALQFAHDQGIVHRDIKPENILLDRRGRVKVADFGLAKIVENRDDAINFSATEKNSGNLTDAGKAMGTPNYMSPEQITAPGEVDHRTDIYALGVVFYQMLTGELPGKKIAPPSTKVQIDVRLDEIVLRALEKNPELRYQQVSEVKTCVETIASDGEKPGIRSQQPEVAPRFSRTAIGGAAALGSAVVFILDFILRHENYSRLDSFYGGEFFCGMVGTILFGTVDGWIAVVQIRRSAGKLCGMWLAVFDGLLFPLLLLDALLEGFWTFILKVVVDPYHQMTTIWALLVFVTIVGLDLLIVRWVWRAVNKSVATPVPPVQKPDRFWRWFAVAVFAMISIPILISIVGLLAAIAIPNFVKARERAQANAQHATQMLAAQNNSFDSTTNFYIGQASFPQGDSIEIISVERTPERMVVKGHYNLVSHDEALLALNITTTNDIAVPTDSRQQMQIFKGHGDFELIHTHLVPGLPHMGMYAWYGEPFAALYFGTKAEAAEEGKLDLGDYQNENQAAKPADTTAQNLSFDPVVERVVNLVGDTNHAIDLNSGRFVVLPIFEDSTNQETNENNMYEAFEFDDKNNVDAEGAVEIPLIYPNGSFAPLPITEKLNGLDCESGTFALQTEVSNWDSAPADWVAEHANNIKPVWDTCHMSGMGELPKVYLFKTREGSLGILQITGFTENPRGVKIRYKLVQNGNANTPSNQNAASVGQDYIAISNSTLLLPSGTTATSIPITLATPSVGVDYTVVTSGTAPLSYQWFFPNTNPSAAPNLSFGPVFERTIYYDKTGKDWLLNLKTGETFSLPPGLSWEKNFSAVLEWLHQHGIHVMGFTVFSQNWHDGDPVPATVVLDQHYGMPVASKRGLYGFEMEAAIMQSPGLTFENITPLQTSNTLQKLVVPAKGNNIGPFLPQFSGMAWHDTAWQGTDDYLYAFQTDDGQSGVLQITGFTKNPRGVKIRYKLVQTNSSAAPQTSEPSDLREAKTRLAELEVDFGTNNPAVQRQFARIKELERLTREEPNTPADLREAKAKLAELRVDYGEQNLHVQEALARIKVLEQNNVGATVQVDDEVARLKLQIADSELEITKKKFRAEVVSQADKNLSASNIVALMQRAYATIYTYRDTGWTVSKSGDYVSTNKFNEMLGRRNLYRIEVITAQNPFSQTNRWWSDGDTEFWQPGSSIVFKNSNPASEASNLSLVNQDSTVPALLYNLNWGNVLKTMSYSSATELVRRKDEAVSGVDCYVLQQANIGWTVWVGKQDFLIRRYLRFISKTAATEAMKHSPNKNSLPAQADITITQTHENVIVNEHLSKDDFLPATNN